MKKVGVFLLIFTIIVCANGAIFANDAPEPGFVIYTAAGNVCTESDDQRLNAIATPGAIVYARYNQFNTKIKTNEIYWGYSLKEFYSCYGNDNSDETLTLGLVFSNNDFDKPCIDIIKEQVTKQINYINSIGGIMTGYKIVNNDYLFSKYALNISWDVADEHHYARFETSFDGCPYVGYYDLCYSETGIVQNDIPYMNENFSVQFEAQ